MAINNKAKQSEYRSIFKATSLFGGVQVWKILIEIVKQKCIAMFLGPAGMGIGGLYTSSIQLIQGLTALGLSQSAVRDVADANASGDLVRVSNTIITIRRLVWVTGLIGTFIVLLLSPVLSRSAFGNYDYTLPFAFLSITLLFNQISSGQLVVLQGLQKYKWLALSGVLGSLVGLMGCIPLYYFFRVDGIVPTLILNSVISLFFTWYFSHKIKVEYVSQTPKQTFVHGKQMLKMGVALSLNSILVTGVGYLIRIIIANLGGTEEVGLYTSGFAIVGGYTGLVFSAMGTDYYPRLSAVNKDNDKCKTIINQQAEIALLIIAPLVVVFSLIAPYIITLLYSDAFQGVVMYLRYSMIAMLLKTAAWAISFVFLAKSDMRQFLFNEISIKIINVPLYFVAYKIGGLNGLGMATIVNYILYLAICYMAANRKYDFNFEKRFCIMLCIDLLLSMLITFLISFGGNINMIIAIVLMCVCCCSSIYLLDMRLGLVNVIVSKFKKN